MNIVKTMPSWVHSNVYLCSVKEKFTRCHKHMHSARKKRQGRYGQRYGAYDLERIYSMIPKVLYVSPYTCACACVFVFVCVSRDGSRRGGCQGPRKGRSIGIFKLTSQKKRKNSEGGLNPLNPPGSAIVCAYVCRCIFCTDLKILRDHTC